MPPTTRRTASGPERTFDFSPGELDEVEERLDLLYRLRKKYGPTVEEMLAYLDRCRQELDQIQYADDTIARLERNWARRRRRLGSGDRPCPRPDRLRPSP
ncbi:MAG: hypothetical protein ACLSUM_13110 [Dysosmobacter welbionis]